MRGHIDTGKLEQFMQTLGHLATTPGGVYLVGGSTALLLGIRDQTIDIDIKLDPEPGGVFQAIAGLKNSLDINVELAAPDQFLPPLPGWKERSIFIQTVGQIVFRHYDLYSQVLAKIERGHDQDIRDARAMMDVGSLQTEELVRLAAAIRSDLIRYPAVDAEDLAAKLNEFLLECAMDNARDTVG